MKSETELPLKFPGMQPGELLTDLPANAGQIDPLRHGNVFIPETFA